MNVKSKQARNSVICLAYLENEYSQIEIANYLGLSKSAIFMLIKNGKSGDWTARGVGFSFQEFESQLYDHQDLQSHKLFYY